MDEDKVLRLIKWLVGRDGVYVSDAEAERALRQFEEQDDSDGCISMGCYA